MEVIDYDKNIITFNGKSFPFKLIEEKTKDGETKEHIISVFDLELELLRDDGSYSYVSDCARWIDEQITYFVDNEKDFNRSDEDIIEKIYG